MMKKLFALFMMLPLSCFAQNEAAPSTPAQSPAPTPPAAQAIQTITDREENFVQLLEGQFQKLIAAANEGNIEVYRSVMKADTVAAWENNVKAANEPPEDALKAFGGSLQALKVHNRKFLRGDRSGSKSRLAYAGNPDKENEFLVIVFDEENGVWKFNHYVLMEKPALEEVLADPAASISESPLPTPPPAAATEAIPQPASSPAAKPAVKPSKTKKGQQ